MKHLSHRPIRRRHVDIRHKTRLFLQSYPEWQDWIESSYSPLKSEEIDILIYYYQSEPYSPYILHISEQRARLKLKRALRKMQFFRYKYELWLLHVTNETKLPIYNEAVLDVPVLELNLSKSLLNLFQRHKWNTMREAVSYSWNDLKARGFTKDLIEELRDIIKPIFKYH